MPRSPHDRRVNFARLSRLRDITTEAAHKPILGESGAPVRYFKSLSPMLFAALALSGIASATALAELPEFTPGAGGTSFTGTSGSGTLTAVGGTVVCKKD